MMLCLFVSILFLGYCSLNLGLQVTVNPSPVAKVLYGEPLSLNCTLSPGWTSIVWDRGSGWVLTATKNACGNNNTNLRLYVTCHGNTIQLHKLQPQEGDQYKCIGNPNMADEASSPMTRVEIYADGPFLNVNHQTVSVRETENARLICEGRGGPNISLNWTYGNGSTSGIRTHSAGKAELLLQNVTRSQSGMYTCNGAFEFRNKQYQNTKSLEVDVQYAPDMTIQPGEVKSLSSGSNITLNCTARGTPSTVNFKPWKHYIGSTFVRELEGHTDGQNADMNTLVLENIQYTDFGKYVCGAENGVVGRNSKILQETSTSISVAYQPIIIGRNQSETYFVEREKEMELSFIYLASPPSSTPLITKEGADSPVQNTSRITIVSQEVNATYNIYGKDIALTSQEVNLKFSPVTDSDSGSYGFHLQNALSSTNQSFQIHALEHPVMPSSLHFDNYPDSITLHWKYGIELDRFHSFLVMCHSKTSTCSDERLEFNETQTDFWYMYEMQHPRGSSEYSLSVCSENPLGKRCTTTFVVKIPQVLGESKQQTARNNGEGDVTLIVIICAVCVVAVIVAVVLVTFRRHKRRKGLRENGSVRFTRQYDDEHRTETTRAVPNNYAVKPGLFVNTKLETVEDGYLTPESVSLHAKQTVKLDDLEKNVYDVIPADLESKRQGKKSKDSPASAKKKSKKFMKADKQVNVGPARPISTVSCNVENQYSTIPMYGVDVANPLNQSRTNQLQQRTHDMDPVPRLVVQELNTYMDMAKKPLEEQENKRVENEYAKSTKVRECGYVAMNKLSNAEKDTTPTRSTEDISDGAEVEKFDAYKY